MADLIGRAFLAMAMKSGCALLISFDQAADYDSPNFLWFRARFDRFVDVDRVVVSRTDIYRRSPCSHWLVMGPARDSRALYRR